ncbi:hypothetical protein SOVF_059240 [Spinacia oleracea]|nr:hypothetical protein SOVF_059240 [Spinacia oleracea]
MNEASSSRLPPEEEVNEKLSRLAKATSFIAHFTARKTDANTAGKLQHSELVKTYVIKAHLEELHRMNSYISDYVSYFHDPVVQIHQSVSHVLVENSADVFTRVFEQAIRTSVQVAVNTLSVKERNASPWSTENRRRQRALFLWSMGHTQDVKAMVLIERYLNLDEFLNDIRYQEIVRGLGLQGGDDELVEVSISKLFERTHVVRERLYLHCVLLRRPTAVSRAQRFLTVASPDGMFPTFFDNRFPRDL